jgi:signal transduction histidine kinase
MIRTFVFLLSRMIFIVCLSLTLSQRASGADQILTHVSEVRALGADKAEQLRWPVKLRGVVTYVLVKGNEFKLWDGTSGIGVRIGDDQEKPKEGDEVEVEGYTNHLSVKGYDYPHVHGVVIRKVGTQTFPAAKRVALSEVTDFKHYDQWVSVEGTIVMWMLNSRKLTLLIASNDEWAEVHVRNVDRVDLPKALHGARVRVTGVNMGTSHSREDTMVAPSQEQLEILKEGTSTIFEAQLKTAEEVLTGQLPAAERVRVKGTLLGKVRAKSDGLLLYIRDGRHALCARIQGGWVKTSGVDTLYGDAGDLPALKQGDVVEVVGTVRNPREANERDAQFYDCHVRVVEEGDTPDPVVATWKKIQAGAHLSDLVQLRARFLSREQSPGSLGLWDTKLNLESDGVQFSAYSKTKQQDVLGSLQANDDLQLSGIVEPSTDGKTRVLRILSPASVSSFGQDPAVRERQLWMWGGTAGVVVLFLGIWVTTLNRALNRQRDTDSELRELNATLEDRVQERTKQLAASQGDLERALKQEQELGELKTRFVTMVSHEFRTPLGITMSAVELMRHYEEKLPIEQRRELCEDIYSATRNMAGLMEQVLVLGRVEAGKLAYRPAPLDLHLLAGKLTDESLSATNRKCPIHWQPENDLSGATADESLLRHIFGNLITNAVKYSPAGSAVRFTARRDGEDAIFEVIDHGIGIPEADREQLFEAFHRCSNVGEVPGTGLGLVIVKRCVELHGGGIEMTSETGKGTTFTVRLPVFVPAVTSNA